MNTSPANKDIVSYDVVVVGGGPAGMMAAVAAARNGANVLLLEKNQHLGKKLLITGGGRCNVTNNKPIVRDMLSQYKAEGKFLFSTFMQHGVKESIDWFAKANVPLKEENEGRMFPATQSAQTVKDAMVEQLEASQVVVRNDSAVVALIKQSEAFLITLKSGEQIQTTSCVVATGGTARPETGSTGEGFTWLSQLGHTLVENSFALVPVTLKTAWCKKLSGITLTDCKVTIVADGKKHSSATGKVLFTHVGLTGPTILNMSKTIGELLSYSTVTLSIDLFPGIDSAEINDTFQTLLTNNANKKVRNALSELIPAAVAKEILNVCKVDAEKKCNSVTKKERVAIIQGVKAVQLEVSGLLGKDKAVVSAGGVSLQEIDFRSMESKVVPGLYLIGDVLNINRPSGGYSLQLCWSTGAVAGTHAGSSANKQKHT